MSIQSGEIMKSNKQKYNVTVDLFHVEWEIDFEIDHSVMTDKDLHLINNFWSNSEDRLDDCDGDIVQVVLKMLARDALFLMVECPTSEKGLIERFKSEEGWPALDGSTGILITYVEALDLDYDAFEVKKVKS